MQHQVWQNLPVFLQLARSGTLTGAAAELGLNHATISRRLDALEAQLGRQLFDRHPRGYAITLAGEALLKTASDMAATLSQGLQTLLPEQGLEGSLRINALEGIASVFLGPVLGRFALLQPRLRIELTVLQQHVAMARTEGDLNIALAAPDSAGFASAPLFDYTLSLYASAAYLDRQPCGGDMPDPRQHRTIGYISDLVMTRELDYFQQFFPGHEPGLQSSSLAMQLDWTRAGQGLCILPDYIARQYGDLTRIDQPLGPIQRRYHVFGRKDDWDSLRLKRLRDFLKAEGRQVVT